MPDPMKRCSVVVIWIDWYPYHVARFRGLVETLPNQVVGIELVGGTGVHTGLKFREELPAELHIDTLMPNASWGTASHFRLARMLWSRLSLLNPEVVLVPGYYTLPAIAAAFWARVHGRTSVLMTESTAGDHKRNWWKERAKSLGLRLLFNWAVAGGKAHLDYLRLLDFRCDRVTGSYDVVDNKFFLKGTESLRKQSPSSFGLPDSKFFLYVGRLSPEKNVVTLLTCWLAYREQGGSWPLVLVGDGPEASTLKALSGSSRFSAHVLFPGLKASRELLPYYAFAGCFVLPSTREPWGLVVNEAMASALPVLVSLRCGCAVDLVTNRNGFVFDPTNSPNLSNLLHTLEQLSPAELRRMGMASAEIIAGFSPAGFGHSIASILKALSPSSNMQQGEQVLTGGSR